MSHRWIFPLVLFLPACVLGASIPVDGSAAVVNDKVITMTKVLRTMQPVVEQLRQNYHDEELSRKMEDAYEKTLDSLIERELILDLYRQQKEFTIPDSVVDNQIDELIHTKFDNNRTAFMNALESDDITIDEWRKVMKNRLIISFMRNKAVDSNVMVSPQAVRKAYEKAIDKYSVPKQVELRMIVIHRGNTEEEVALKKKQAEEVRKQLLSGEEFDALAKEVSEGSKASEGGYWGWAEPDSRRRELAEVLETLNPGEISKVIEAGEELYILKIGGRKNATVIPFEDVQKSIRNDLRQKETQRLYKAWIDRLKKKSYIKKF